jgi:Chaperone of endosialidase
MSLSSPSVPAVPDPTTTAAAQQNLNTQTLTELEQANNVNQVTPTGSLTYAQTGTGANGVPTYTATQTLTPAEQQLLTTMQGTQNTAGTQAGNLLTNANYGAPGTNPATTIGNSTSGETQALLGQETSYLNPQFNEQTSQLQTQLASQGIYPGSPAYTQQMQNLQLNQNQAVTGFLATAEPAAYQQATSSYELPLTMASTEMGLAQPAGVGLTSTPQESSQPANLEGDVASANTANMAAYNAQLTQQNAMLSGLFGLGAASISGGTGGFGNSLAGSAISGTGAFAPSPSDRRIKKNIDQVGTLFDGTPIYRYQFIDGPQVWHIGVMAQDIEQFEPGAVVDIGGVKHVEYFRATERAARHGN